MASLVILIFLTPPWHSSSSVQSSFFSTGCGFLFTIDCEYMIGVALLPLVTTPVGVLGVVGVPPEAVLKKSVERGVGVLLRRLAFRERDLRGVLLRRLALRERREKKLSSALLVLVGIDATGVVGSSGIAFSSSLFLVLRT